MKCEVFHDSPTEKVLKFRLSFSIEIDSFLVVFDPTEIKQNKFQCLACICFKV